jgi:hypothetical protein
MTTRTDILNRIYVPASMGAATLYHDFDPDYHLGVVFGIHSQKYRPLMSEDEGVGRREPVTAEIMQQVVDDVVWCPWRLKRDKWVIYDDYAAMKDFRVYDGDVTRTYLYFAHMDWKGVRTYTDLIALVRLANG